MIERLSTSIDEEWIGARAPSTCYVVMRSVGGVPFPARSGVKRVNPRREARVVGLRMRTSDSERGPSWHHSGAI